MKNLILMLLVCFIFSCDIEAPTVNIPEMIVDTTESHLDGADYELDTLAHQDLEETSLEELEIDQLYTMNGKVYMIYDTEDGMDYLELDAYALYILLK